MMHSFFSNPESRFLGCLLGGAVGDSLGYPIEFNSLKEIKRAGFAIDQKLNSEGLALVSDDTQMTILTAHSLLNSTGNIFQTSLDSYRKWVDIMYNVKNISHVFPEFRDYPTLFAPRSTGVSRYNALSSGQTRNISKPINSSKGNGAIMRIAPVGLMYSDPEQAFINGMHISALTHGRPTGYFAAATFASMISVLVRGSNISSH